jgi:hypothetical protein
MSTKHYDLEAGETGTCRHCGRAHTPEAPLRRVSVKTMYEDDFHYECKSGPCMVSDEEAAEEARIEAGIAEYNRRTAAGEVFDVRTGSWR